MSNMHLVYWGPHVRTLFWVYGVIRTLTSDLIVQVHSLECLCVCVHTSSDTGVFLCICCELL